MNEAEKKKFVKDMQVEADTRRVIELLQNVFDSVSEETNLKKSEIAAETGISASVISRVLNGRQKNLTVKTVARILRSMGHRFQPESIAVSELQSRKPNFEHPVFLDFSALRSGGSTELAKASVSSGTTIVDKFEFLTNETKSGAELADNHV